MAFAGRVIVVAVDLLDTAYDVVPVRETGDDPIHHLGAVQGREPLRPPQCQQVGRELIVALDQVGEIGVGERDPAVRALLARHGDVPTGKLVSDTPRAGMQEQPDLPVLVLTGLDEMVA